MLLAVVALLAVCGCAGPSPSSGSPTSPAASPSPGAHTTGSGAPARSGTGADTPSARTSSTRPTWPPEDGSWGEPSTADAPPPYIASATWVQGQHGRSLHVVPTAAGRDVHGGDSDEVAWHEVVRFAPDAASPGMKAQFLCHWTYARLVEPNKPSWNLEPWRPVVSDKVMSQTRCNPGGPE